MADARQDDRKILEKELLGRIDSIVSDPGRSHALAGKLKQIIIDNKENPALVTLKALSLAALQDEAGPVHALFRHTRHSTVVSALKNLKFEAPEKYSRMSLINEPNSYLSEAQLTGALDQLKSESKTAGYTPPASSA
jgi:hypothetical protein